MKKRYQLSLTPANVEKFQDLAKAFSMDKGQLSRSVDDFIQEMNRTMERCRAKGSANVLDLFTMIGENIQAHLEELKNEGKPTQETKVLAKKSSRRK